VEGEERGQCQEAESDEMIPADRLAQVRHREYPENGERDDLLNSLKLRRRIDEGAVRRQTVAVLFVDIVGFTRMAERMTPEAVVTMLRQFHDRMTAQIFACDGTVEKYIGDEIFAVFGLPEAAPDDAANALRCADMMLAALERWNAERAAAAEPPLAIGIGLNYGAAVTGDVGSEQSLAFSVIGDTVNAASRLQGLTRSLVTPLVISDALVVAAKANATGDAARLVGTLQDRGEHSLRGRSEPVRIWTAVRVDPGG
jgi:adenylate cyclase